MNNQPQDVREMTEEEIIAHRNSLVELAKTKDPIHEALELVSIYEAISDLNVQIEIKKS